MLRWSRSCDSGLKKRRTSMASRAFNSPHCIHGENIPKLRKSLIDFKIRDIITSNFDLMDQNWVHRVQNHFKFNNKNINPLFC